MSYAKTNKIHMDAEKMARSWFSKYIESPAEGVQAKNCLSSAIEWCLISLGEPRESVGLNDIEPAIRNCADTDYESFEEMVKFHIL